MIGSSLHRKEFQMETQTVIGTAGQALKNMFKGMSDDMHLCIQNCVQCHQFCEQTLQHCLQMGGLHAAQNHIRLLQDCAAFCATSADFMMRDSALHSRVCAVCAEICVACAIDCERMSSDKIMQACAEACRRCADSCSKMAVQH
jgi:hypothetical protein